MFHPVGSKPSSVYWRRRLLLIGAAVAIVVLGILTATTLTGGDKGSVAGGSPSAHRGGSTSATHTSAASTPAASSSSASTSGASTAVPTTCKLAALQVAAVVGQKSYRVGESPTVELQVTNSGPDPCVQNLADSQIELRVYNGSSRVWGSHDCAIQPGTNNRTLAVGRPYLSAVVWGGLSSQPGCKGQRQRIGAGTYTLYALLSGKSGTPTTFTIT